MRASALALSSASMKTRLLSSLLAVGLVLGACSKKEETASTPTPPAAPTEQAANDAPSTDDTAPPSGLPSRVEQILAEQKKAADAFASTLDEDKVARLVAYEKEMAKHTELLLGVASEVVRAGSGEAEKVGKELSRDERIKKISEVSEKALSDAGVTQGEVASWTTLISELVAGEMSVAGAREKVAELEAKGDKGVMLQVYKDQVAEHDEKRRQFAEKHGEKLLGILDKHMAELIEIRQMQMDVAMGRNKKK